MNRAEAALQFICSDDRNVWVGMGMALQSEYGDAAREIWMDWSRQSDRFKEADARAVWRSFRGAGVSIASLFHEAKQNGWRDQGFQKPTDSQIAEQKQIAAQRHTEEGKQREIAAKAAATKAQWILSQCKHEKHAYLHSKGFQELEGLVWYPTELQNLLCIPMYVGGKLAGVQMIDRDGAKKYLSGQITSQAEFCIDSGAISPIEFWVEGYASGLSLQACLNALKVRYRIHVTFSANNLQRMAHSGYVIADNDASQTGQKAAQATGLPYWAPVVTGEDINDVWKREGTFRTSQILRKWMQEQRQEASAT